MMSDFEKELHAMFDNIWDCEIDHPMFQDTVGELMEAVIQAHEKHNLTHGTNLVSLGTDCISRQAALNEFCHSCDGWSCNPNTCCKTEWIRKLPPIQPKRGKWILVTDNNGQHFECNRCGEWRYHQEQKFCGECGADMRGEQDG